MLFLYDIPVIYINLEKRKDRNTNVLNELKKINITQPIRLNAVETKNGAIGCSLSHIKCLELAIKNDYDYIMICEDDIEIIDKNTLIKNVQQFLNSNIKWDVLLLAGNNMLPYDNINNYCIQIYNCLTTTCYIVQKHYFSTLLDNYRTGVKNLITNQDNTFYRIDKYWNILQNKDRWFLLIPPSMVQREDYSDIEKKRTNFKNYMLNYNKVIKK